MIQNFKRFVLAALLLLLSQFSFAGTTEDLWKALKSANDKDALTAINAGADVNNIDGGTSPLLLAAAFSDGEVVKALIDKKATIDYVHPGNGLSPLMNAANWGNTEAVKLLLAAGANFKLKSKLGIPVVALATASSKLEIIKMIVDAGADPNERYTVGTIELVPFNTLTGVYDQKEKVENLAANKPYIEKAGLSYSQRLVNAKPEDFTPLYEITKYFLSKGADPNLKVTGTWGTIIFQAAEFGKNGMVKALLEAKVDINTKGKFDVPLGLYEITLLQVSAIKGNNELVDMLCKSGADINYITTMKKREVKIVGKEIYTHITSERQTAVSFALEAGHPETVELLKKYGGLGPKEIKKKK